MTLIATGILACEIGFWILLGLGLFTRYVVGSRRLSSVLLACVPVLDLLLLLLIGWDLVGRGATADPAHGLGAIYLGFTVAFGRQIIRRVDRWFAHRFAGGPAPVKPPARGPERVRYEWSQWFRMLGCAVIASVVLGGTVLIVGDAARTGELLGWIARVWLLTGVWLVGWPIWVSLVHVVTPTPRRFDGSGAADRSRSGHDCAAVR